MQINPDEIKANSNIIDVIGRYVQLEKKGSEHYGICPFHNDHETSLMVNEKKQIFKCFACGGPDGKGGDSIQFLQGMGRSFKEACAEIKGESISGTVNPVQNTIKTKSSAPEWKYIPNPSVDPVSFNHYKLGKPSMKWAYKNQYGNIIGYVCRFDLPNKEKQVLPYSFATDGTREEWRWMGMDTPRPLYNLDLIYKYPNAAILIVEGEKTADAAQAQLSPEKNIVTTWIGGANGIKNADFTPLNNRRIIYWADNDAPGFKAMNEISSLIGTKIEKFISIPDIYPKKWDAADKDWKKLELLKFVSDNFSDDKYEITPAMGAPAQKSIKSAPKLPKNPPLPPVTIPDEPEENEHYRMLGYDKDENSGLVYFFFSFDAKSVIKLKPTSMNKSNFMMLAPINYWEDTFPAAKTKFDLDAAQQYLISHSHGIGPFREKYIRGRGAWMEKDKLIVHTGENLLIDKQTVPLKSFKSRYVYEIGENLGFGNDKSLSNTQANALIKKLEWLNWDRDISAYLLAGWCVIAPFCGVLKWRPHIWITGAAGTGKSKVMENFVKRLMGDIAIVVQGKTTEAGVRGTLQSDARPVLFDESDVENHNDKERIQSILSLARSSSYSDGGSVLKGTQSGGSRSYVMRSCFAFSSIGVQTNHQSDRSRFTILSLNAFEGVRTDEEYEEFEKGWNEMVNEDYVHSLQSRTMELIPIILKNAKIFSDAVSIVIKNKRIGDQVGGMLAGAYSLTSKKIITHEKAIEFVRDRNWDDEKGLEATRDENQLFSLLMSYIVRVEGVTSLTVERSIGELILCSADKLSDIGVTQEKANSLLRRKGIMINDDRVYFSNTAPGIKEIIRNTAWANNHNKILERLPDAEKLEPRTFAPGLKSRGISLPLEMISDGFEYQTFSNPDILEKYKAEELSFDGDEEDMPF